jgi:hypothetical protein
MNCSLFVEGNSRIGIAAGVKIGNQFFHHRLETGVDLLGGLDALNNVRVHERSFRRLGGWRFIVMRSNANSKRRLSGLCAKHSA